MSISLIPIISSVVGLTVVVFSDLIPVKWKRYNIRSAVFIGAGIMLGTGIGVSI